MGELRRSILNCEKGMKWDNFIVKRFLSKVRRVCYESLVVSLPVKAAEHLGEITQDRTISAV